MFSFWRNGLLVPGVQSVGCSTENGGSFSCLLFFAAPKLTERVFIKQRNKKNKFNLHLRFYLPCVNSLIRNKLSFGEGVRRTVRGEGERRRTFKVRSKLLFFPVVTTILNKLLSATPLVFVIYFQIFTDNYFNLNHRVNVSFSLSLFRFIIICYL